ncbi:4-coumarate--CoA ligase-like 5 [Nymphon striatum]|nr:4-coumarate--CoA ligase-like 5 [Nymphon striatum]
MTRPGELPKAFVTLAPGASHTGEEIQDFIADQVASYKKIRLIEFIDETGRIAAETNGLFRTSSHGPPGHGATARRAIAGRSSRVHRGLLAFVVFAVVATSCGSEPDEQLVVSVPTAAAAAPTTAPVATAVPTTELVAPTPTALTVVVAPTATPQAAAPVQEPTSSPEPETTAVAVDEDEPVAPAPTAVPVEPTPPPVAGSQAVLAANGGEVYTLNCARCHAENGTGTDRYGGLIGVGSKYSSAGMIDELTNGHPVTFGFASRLSAEEIASVVAYVKQVFP